VAQSRPFDGFIPVVDDDALIRLNATEALESAGYLVLSAENADEAVALLKSRSDIEVVFSDIRMPGAMDGFRLAAMVTDRWPPIGIVLTSGTAKPSDANLPTRVRFILKPYTEDQLLQEIQGCIADRAA
jgi:CheY-like chemotaxis protein